MTSKAPLYLLVLLFLLPACGGDVSFTPKPRGYPKVIYPEKSYQSFDPDFCQFTFEYPEYAVIQQDTTFFEGEPKHPCWFDVYVPDLNSRIHFSYYPVGPSKSLEQLKQDAFEMADWHNKRANYIEEIRIEDAERDLYGFAFDIEGPSASSFQFYLTDSTEHFLRGALYFNAKAEPDSLAPINKFIKSDINHLIETFRWKDEG